MKISSFKNLLAFLILMGNEKILRKSPEYIIEKYNRYVAAPLTLTSDEFLWGLDRDNFALLQQYLTTWETHLKTLFT